MSRVAEKVGAIKQAGQGIELLLKRKESGHKASVMVWGEGCGDFANT